MRTLVLLFGVALPLGCGAKAAQSLPDDPEQLVIYSIDGPYYVEHEGMIPPEKQKDALHGYPVLGKVVVADREKRRAVVRALKDASTAKTKPATKFNPRHAIGILHAGQSIELLISFQYQNYLGYREYKPLSESPKFISQQPEALLDELLTEAGVPLAPRVKHESD